MKFHGFRQFYHSYTDARLHFNQHGFDQIYGNQNDKVDDFIPRFNDDLVELLDVFPTIVDLAGIRQLKSCPSHSNNIITCTEGRSLAEVIQEKISDILSNNSISYLSKRVVFSQYPRPGLYPSAVPDSDQPRLQDIRIMGYSARTSRFRLTLWLPFNNATFYPDFSNVIIYALKLHPLYFFS